MLLVMRNKATNLHKRFYRQEDACEFIGKLIRFDTKMLKVLELPTLIHEYLPNWEVTIHQIGNETVSKSSR